MTPYEKYLAKLRFGIDTVVTVLPVITQAPYVGTEGEVDARIRAVEQIITTMQDVKRALIYFKRRAKERELVK